MAWWKNRIEIFNRDKELIEKNYPSLSFKENGDILSIEGAITLRTKSGIPEKIRVKIDFPGDYPESAPKAFDVDKQFGGNNPDRHIDNDDSFCLYFPEKEKFDFVRKHNILDFLDILSIFLKKQLIYERTKKWPGDEEPHGIEALEKLIYEKFFGNDAPDIRSSLKRLWMTKDKVGRNKLCPCGSGRKYKKCHLAYVDIMKNARREYCGKH